MYVLLWTRGKLHLDINMLPSSGRTHAWDYYILNRMWEYQRAFRKILRNNIEMGLNAAGEG
jgi:hypothetical protein